MYIVQIVDTDPAGGTKVWFVGPYGWSLAHQTADELRSIVDEDTEHRGARECSVEPLFSNGECLRVTNSGRSNVVVPSVTLASGTRN
ncbi:MAG: hypothetical protein DI630_00225 [Gordonia sp. (in: high G+C Gram-positive bacteria)]|nr:MAG: hypothetical protein DI630_00225 [Gordonia sp. (in: high G+C Gram-positive bacteria)]